MSEETTKNGRRGEEGKENDPGPNAGHPEVPENGRPRSLDIAAAGVRTSVDFAKLMSAIMSDTIEGRVTPSVANAACNAGGKLLKVVDLQMKYGTKSSGNQKVLDLCQSEETKNGSRIQELRRQLAEAEAEEAK